MILRENVSLVWDTLVKSKHNYDVVKYLNNPATEEEFKTIQKSSFLKDAGYSLWKMCIIDLHKLYSTSRGDKISITNLLNKIENKHYKDHNISNELLLKWMSDLTTNQPSIDKVSYLRNKLYAHTDLNIKEEVDLYFKEVQDLFDVAERILIDIFSTSFDTQLRCFMEPERHNGQREVQAIMKGYKARRMEIESSYKSNRTH